MWDHLDAKQNAGKSLLCGSAAMWIPCPLLWKMQALKLCAANCKHLCLSYAYSSTMWRVILHATTVIQTDLYNGICRLKPN